MEGLSFFSAIEEAFSQVLTAFATWLPFVIAYISYDVVLNLSKDAISKSHLQKGFHVLIAAGIVALIVVAGQRCVLNEYGYCNEDDWKPPTSQENLTNFLRLSMLTLGGMATAFYRTYRARN